MRATLFLAASAWAVNGEIHAVRIGMPTVVPGTPFAVAGIITVPFVDAFDQQHFRCELVDADGTLFEFTTDDGETHHVAIEGTHGAGIPAGHPAGSPRNIAMAGNFAGVPLSFGTRYEFRLSINGETDDRWTVGFDTPPPPLSKAA